MERTVRYELLNSIIDPQIKVKVERDVSCTSHYHCHEFIEVVYCEEGRGVQVINGKDYVFEKGDIFLFNGGVFHKFNTESTNFSLINVMFHADLISEKIHSNKFICDYANTILGEDISNINEVPFLHLKIKTNDNNLRIYIEDFLVLLNEYTFKKTFYKEVLKSQVLSLLAMLFREYVSYNDNQDAILNDYDEEFNRMLKYIDTNLPIINSLNDLKPAINYNVVYFSRVFKRKMGVSISQYIKQKKLDFACRLLISSNYPIESICEMVGYGDMKNFYVSFKKVKGVTPSVYRKNMSRRV